MSVQRIAALTTSVMVLAAGALTGSTAGAAGQAAERETAAAAVTVSISDTRMITMPTVVQPGVNKFEVTSAKASQLQIISLHEGYTQEEAEADIKRGLEGRSVKALKRFEANVTLIGGLSSRPDKPARFWVDLEPGSYVALDVRGKANASKWVSFSATGADTGASMPAGKTIRAVRSARWANKPNAIPNKGTLTFKNRTSQNHFLIMVKLRRGATLTDLEQFLQNEQGPPPVVFRHSLDTGVISPGRTLAVKYRLPRGNYAMLCFWPDASMGGMPHAFMGMVRTIRLK